MGRVLVVDDEPAVLFTLKEVLLDRGHEPVTAASGAEALGRLDGVDAVITDLTMPGMDGLALVAAVRERDAALPVVLLTAHGSEKVAVQAMKAGAYDYATKPFDIDEILAVVERALEARALRSAARIHAAEQALGKRIVGTSPAMRRLLDAVARVADAFPPMISTNPPQATGGGADRNSIPLYDFPSWKIESHRLLTMPLRTSALRTLGAQGNVFAIESFLDEITAESGEDPVGFRLRHLSDERAKDVIGSVARRVNWKPAPKPGIGYGIGFARYKNTGAYCAAIAEIEGQRDIHVRRLTIAIDVGEAVNPDGVQNQIEGGAIQATSWALKERVRFDAEGITSNNWTDYPILHFSEVPAVEVEVIQRPEIDPVGAGEAALGPVTAAIANAVFDGLGVRVRKLPITRDSLIAGMDLST